MLIKNKHQQLNWTKNHGLIPAIVQHARSGEVLMLGHMSKESMIKTEQTKHVTFFSRSKNRLWTKGETSGNTLKLINWHSDCDHDTLLIFVVPHGPTCHNKTSSCFHPGIADLSFLYQLEKIISSKKNIPFHPNNSSYTSRLYASGIKRIAQKVGEEGLETALAALSDGNNTKELINEASDLIYHLLVLLQSKSSNFDAIIQELKTRHHDSKQIKHDI
ncbi:bifunctional phosphoribosyl-AMP cyclohydrolase/phosphoribosyl-ATP diphosphatase HisIE [Blochmannia endosymbiont of Camponotus sp.]|uniref:bifunctional phosphoribosyl-AMP cyclohydrolase/phosphoribosyl-ATP diphosphatase HisIE n=1 Tax=Blochmannia endosymbiont of Camponotus sp. TaxID=700220 RepID=UPI002024AAF2|nr:bifunctional phosphoribosyl-AMP cyclohydrolase/phosphoribosyl-ATP diphosphatase HisIE [Blochmannia endosymbiont of Camponotus sp.]URJ29928.1 bifunctional phosphoribosyl-AMP cyclohydrolase/phosphoribosyl-ATP diphosphatase HisIE [Blochmannia endosymbiont of Camponotus sp.]